MFPRPRRGLAYLLPAVLPGLASLLEEHRRAATAVEPKVEPVSRRGAAEPTARRVEPRAHVPRSTELRALRARARHGAPEAPVRALDALRDPARAARRRARARGGAEARPAHVPARARVVLPRGDGRDRRRCCAAVRGRPSARPGEPLPVHPACSSGCCRRRSDARGRTGSPPRSTLVSAATGMPSGTGRSRWRSWASGRGRMAGDTRETHRVGLMK